MARTDSLKNFLTDIANSIKRKSGITEPILAFDFDKEIDITGKNVSAGFIDIHIHGDGTSFRWNSNPEQVAKHHLQHGSTTMVATMSYGQTPDSLLNPG